MSIKIDIHRKSRVWKIGNDQGIFYGKFDENEIPNIFGAGILADNPIDDRKVSEMLSSVIDGKFHDQLTEIALVIKLRINAYPVIKAEIEALI